MSDQAVFRATVHGLRTVPSRKVVQVILELPIEHLMAAASVCEHGTWVAVARICSESGEIEKHERSWEELSLTEQAGVLCRDAAFWRYLQERTKHRVTTEEQAATVVRELCRVRSRSELAASDISGMRWKKLVEDYRVWQLAPKIGLDNF